MIDDLYSKIKLDNSYFVKYQKLPDFPGTGMFSNVWTGWEGHDFPRAWCLLDFIEWTDNLTGENLAFTSWADPELEFIYHKYKNQSLLEYPEYDLHSLTDRSLIYKFDFFLFNQTLEHLFNPFLALKNINRVLKPNGYVFTSVPTINIPHMTPSHFWGMTPMGLAILFHNSGFEIIKMGQWGNYKYISKLFETHSWPDYNDLKDENGIVVNEEKNCCQCWILAKKKF